MVSLTLVTGNSAGNGDRLKYKLEVVLRCLDIMIVSLIQVQTVQLFLFSTVHHISFSRYDL